MYTTFAKCAMHTHTTTMIADVENCRHLTLHFHAINPHRTHICGRIRNTHTVIGTVVGKQAK